MSYLRTIPRDLFNEAKLLKCLGRLSLLIHDGKAPSILAMEVESSRHGFGVEQDPSDGRMYAENVLCFATYPGCPMAVRLYTVLNDRDPYPLLFEHTTDEDVDHEGQVFNDDGSLHPDFLSTFS
jgi:hypothetical protein